MCTDLISLFFDMILGVANIITVILIFVFSFADTVYYIKDRGIWYVLWLSVFVIVVLNIVE